MAEIQPFRAFRYDTNRVPLEKVLTQPYDRFAPPCSGCPTWRPAHTTWYGLFSCGRALPVGHGTLMYNAYTRANQKHLENWIAEGILARDAEPGLFAYFQESHGAGYRRTWLVRKGFIGLGAGGGVCGGLVVHRHEQTLSGPKKDRLELLRHTHAHFGQLFMLYSDPVRLKSTGCWMRRLAATSAAGRCDRRIRRAASATGRFRARSRWGVNPAALWRRRSC